MKAMRIEVDSFSYENLNAEGKEFSLESTLKTEIDIKQPNEKDKIGHLVLNVSIAGEKGKKSPFILSAKISGYFLYESDFTDKEIKQSLEIDGIRLLYPHMRSLVSSLTGDALIKPFQLPLICLNEWEKINK